VFEQSLVIDQGTKKPWNFLASLGVELLALSLLLVLPLLYSEHLPAVPWKEIVVGPPPAPPPVMVQTTHSSGATNSTPSASPRPVFVYNPSASSHAASNAPIDFGVEAPPNLGIQGGLGGENTLLGKLVPNVLAPPPPKPTIVGTQQPDAPRPVGGDVQMAKVIRKVIPVYPPIAKGNRISGTVRLIGVIGKDGTIQNLQLVSGPPFLVQAAMDAVRQWLYKPTLLNGAPVEVIAPIEVNFTLQ
jgi:periplasmic protein TonB